VEVQRGFRGVENGVENGVRSGGSEVHRGGSGVVGFGVRSGEGLKPRKV